MLEAGIAAYLRCTDDNLSISCALPIVYRAMESARRDGLRIPRWGKLE